MLVSSSCYGLFSAQSKQRLSVHSNVSYAVLLGSVVASRKNMRLIIDLNYVSYVVHEETVD